MHELVTFIAKYFVAVPVLVLAYIFWKSNRFTCIKLVVMLAVSAVICVVLVKLATTVHQDPRPFVRDGVTPYFASSTDNGFPSDHTTFSALIGFVVLYFRRRAGVALLVLSLVIGGSRVIAGVHHGQDIIGGFCLAAVSVGLAWLTLKATSFFKNTQKPL